MCYGDYDDERHARKYDRFQWVHTHARHYDGRSAGVPGGAIMAALGILEGMLGFDETAQALMIALYIAMDSFGTACNVTGDGAIAVIVDRIDGKKENLMQHS